jgi:hypothetical protein
MKRTPVGTSIPEERLLIDWTKPDVRCFALLKSAIDFAIFSAENNLKKKGQSVKRSALFGR